MFIGIMFFGYSLCTAMMRSPYTEMLKKEWRFEEAPIEVTLFNEADIPSSTELQREVPRATIPSPFFKVDSHDFGLSEDREDSLCCWNVSPDGSRVVIAIESIGTSRTKTKIIILNTNEVGSPVTFDLETFLKRIFIRDDGGILAIDFMNRFGFVKPGLTEVVFPKNTDPRITIDGKVGVWFYEKEVVLVSFRDGREIRIPANSFLKDERRRYPQILFFDDNVKYMFYSVQSRNDDPNPHYFVLDLNQQTKVPLLWKEELEKEQLKVIYPQTLPFINYLRQTMFNLGLISKLVTYEVNQCDELVPSFISKSISKKCQIHQIREQYGCIIGADGSVKIVDVQDDKIADFLETHVDLCAYPKVLSISTAKMERSGDYVLPLSVEFCEKVIFSRDGGSIFYNDGRFIYGYKISTEYWG